MSHIIADRVKEKIQSPASTGILSLLNTTSGYRRFSSVMSSGDTCYYCLECPSNGDWECGLGTYSSNNALSRTAVYSSSNGGAVVNFANRVSYVFISYVASRAIYLDPSGELNLALNTLNDVSLTAPASGESLKYNGSSWVNGVVAGYTTEEAQDAVGGILADTSSISFSYNDGAPSIAASVRGSGITDVMISGGVDALKIGSGTVSSTEFGYLDGVTSSLQVQLDSKYDSANPSGYISASGVAAAYQPLDADLTSLAAASGSGIYERSGGSWTPVVIGSGLSLGSGTLSNTLDLSSYLTSSVASGTYLPLAGGTLTGDLKFTDATYDIGKSGLTRPRDGWFSRNLAAGGTITAGGDIITQQYGRIYFPGSTHHYSIGSNYPEVLTFARNGTAFAQMLWGSTQSGSYTSGLQLELNACLSWLGAAGVYPSSPPSLIITRDADGVLHQRNSTNAQTFRLAETWTSSTSFGTFQIKAVAASAYQIGSAVGSAGGTNRAIEIGHYSSGGTFTSALSIATSGAATFAGAITASNLSGTNTGDQDLSSYATTSAVAAGYVSLSTTNTITGLKTFRSDGAPLSQTFQCYNPSTANGVQILNYKARGSLATPLYPAANDIILGHYCYGHDENTGAFSAVKASYICSIPDAWTATSNSTQWTWVTTDTLDATKTAANRMRLQSDGSLTVGGITQSGGLLELVKSNTGLTGFGAALNRMRFSDSDTTTAANQPIGEIEFYSYDATAPGAGVKGSFLCVAESATPAAAFVWGLDATTGVVSEVMRLSSVGLLTVVGGIKSTKGIYFTSEPTGTPAGTTQTLTLADGNHQTLALTSATGTVTATLTVPSGSSSGTIIVKQHASAAKDITWAVSAGTIKWMGTEPDWGSDAVSSVRLVSWRWDGSVMYLASTDVGT